MTWLKIWVGMRIMVRCPELIPYLLPRSIRRLFVPDVPLWK